MFEARASLKHFEAHGLTRLRCQVFDVLFYMDAEGQSYDLRQTPLKATGYDGLSETLDLIVVGAYFGDSARRRALQGQSTDLADHCSQFLLAALRHSSTPEASVVTVCRVGTGFSMDQLKEMRAKLRPYLKRPKSKPDAVLDSPSHGFVMEEYEFGHTLRFPRAVKAFRDDKAGNLEAYVVRHGGRHVQNFLRGRTSLVVAASLSDLRTQNLAKTAQVDIVLCRTWRLNGFGLHRGHALDMRWTCV
eukprot:Skav216430  [mRNA]  locus=scaffold3139:314877:323558:- [translate_table: standard]